FQAEDGIRDFHVTGVQTCALPILRGGFGRCFTLTAQFPAQFLGAVLQDLLKGVGAGGFRAELVEGQRGVAIIGSGEAGEINLDRSEERRVGKEWRRSGARERESSM